MSQRSPDRADPRFAQKPPRQGDERPLIAVSRRDRACRRLPPVRGRLSVSPWHGDASLASPCHRRHPGLPDRGVTGGAFPRKVGGKNRTVTAGRRPWWPRMAGLQPLSTRAFGPRLRRLTALTALATRPLIATKRSTVRCGQSVCKCHAEKFRSAIFARILTAVHTRPSADTCGAAIDAATRCSLITPAKTDPVRNATPSRPRIGSMPARPRCCRPITSTSPSRYRKSCERSCAPTSVTATPY